MKSILGYEIGSFTDVDTSLRDNIWIFLNDPVICQNMINTSLSGRLAIEGIIFDLAARFGNVFTDREKMCTGFLIKQVMISNGYDIDKKGRKVKQNPIFNKSTMYKIIS